MGKAKPIEEESEVRNDRRNWSWGKEVPIAPLIALVLQTLAGVAWLSDLNASVKTTRTEVVDLKSEMKVLASKVEIPTLINGREISDIRTEMSVLKSQMEQVRTELIRISARNGRK